MYEQTEDVYSTVPFLKLLFQNQAMADVPAVPPMPNALRMKTPSPRQVGTKELDEPP